MSDARHKVELHFEGGVMTAKLICPPDSECSEHEGHCNARDWFDNVSPEEILEGKVTVPAVIAWPGSEEAPEIKLDPVDRAQQTRDERKIIKVFVDELPETVRIMNLPSIVDEIELGKGVTADDEDRPPQEVYDRYEIALDNLVEAGILKTMRDWEITVYALAQDGFDRIADQVANFLRHKAVALKLLDERGEGELDPGELQEALEALEKVAAFIAPEEA